MQKRLDIKFFAQMFVGMCEYYDRKVSDALVEMYYNGLKDCTNEQLEDAVKRLMYDISIRKMTLIPDIRRAIFGDPETQAILAWEKFEKALMKYHSYMSYVFDDANIHTVIDAMEGIIAVAETPEKEWKWLRKNFIDLYKVHSQNPRQDMPKRLAGRIEIANGALGIDHMINIAVVGETSEVRTVKISFSSEQIESASVPQITSDPVANLYKPKSI